MWFDNAKGEEFYLPDKMKVYKMPVSSFLKPYFTDILNYSKQPQKNIAEIKSAAYKILAYLGTIDKEHKINSSKYKWYSEGISYLELYITIPFHRRNSTTVPYFSHVFQTFI